MRIGSEVEKTSLSPILSKRLQITGSTLRSRSPAYQTALVQRFGQEILPKISSRPFGEGNASDEFDGNIQVVIHQTYPLSDIVKAHKELEEDRSIGKIVIEVD
jgi:NADPH:quinone reductase-like Zn-dependent oxidoreductase